MPPKPPDRADAIFSEALGLPPEEREAHIAATCGDDADLLAEVRSLLEVHEEAPTDSAESPAAEEITGGDLDATLAADGSGKTSGKPAGPVETTDSDSDDEDVDPLSLLRAFKESSPDASLPESLTEKAGDVIGSYKLLQPIGEGGFGTVWMAEQSEPISRKVALKVIKAGMDTKEVLARFEAERQAVALMDHTHIAKVLDAGATKSGRPWFAMELVKGIPITEFCDEQKLGTRQRLELFGDVCSAINHAHQKGVIHRDIKPSNVMVTLDGDKPVVKVIDFGIAKATQSKLTEKTLFTAFEQMLGTPIYMSPEQAGLSRLDIDTRSDIYSLGVLLYELLTGKPPFDGKTLISAGYEEMRRIIREDEPPRPSLRLSTVSEKDETTRITSTHGVEPQKLSRLVRGELDWIVMKAIEKDRSRRYETANAFAADIGRYLNDEPVQAAAPSAAYKFRKFAHRNKAAIGTAALIASVLIAATGVSTWQAIEAHRARVQSDKDKEEAEGISSYLIDVFQSPDPARDGRTITVAETLENAVKKLETDLADQPERRLELLRTLGDTYHALGLYSEAIPLIEKALAFNEARLGRDHPETLTVMSELASMLLSQGRYEDAEPLFREALEGQEKALGRGHDSTLNTIQGMGKLLQKLGRYEDAEALFREVLEAAEAEGKLATGQARHHPRMLNIVNDLAIVLQWQEKYAEAEPLFREALEGYEKALGRDHLWTLNAMNSLANLLGDQGGDRKLKEAEPLSREALEGRQRILDRDHPDTLISVGNLASILRMREKLPEAEQLAREAVEGKKVALGRNHSSTLISIRELAMVLEARGKLEEAERLYREAHEGFGKELGVEHPYVAGAKKGWERLVKILNNPGYKPGKSSQVADLVTPFRAKGVTPLHRAAYGDSTELVRTAIDAGADVNAQDEEGFTPLHNAVEFGKFQHLPILLQHGADPDLPNVKGYTPLMTAAKRFGDMETILLLKKAGAKLDSIADGNVTMLHQAAGGGHPEVVKFLLEAGLPVNTPTRDTRYTPLLVAAFGASGQRVLHAPNPDDVPESRGSDADYTKVVELLLAGGADINQRDAAARTPLHVASGNGQVKIARLLLSAGAEIEAKDKDGSTPLHLAVGSHGSKEMAVLLLSEGAEVMAVTPDDRTPLHRAASYSSAEVVALLLEHGADIDAVQRKHPSKATPLAEAVGTGKIENIELLLARGADFHKTYFGVGATLLHLAAQSQQVESAKLLLEAGIEVDARDAGGMTPLISSAMWANLEMPRLLIDRGADVNAKNREGFTAFMVARNQGNYAMERLLKGDTEGHRSGQSASEEKVEGAGPKPEMKDGKREPLVISDDSIRPEPKVQPNGNPKPRDQPRTMPKGMPSPIPKTQTQSKGKGKSEPIESHRRAIELDPDDADAHNNLGFALGQQGQTEEAIESLRRAIELDPENAMAHVGLGGALGQQGQTEEAIESLRRAIELDPENAMAHVGLGGALLQQGKTEKAIESLRRAIELDPELALAHNNLGFALGQQGQTEEAIESLRRAIELDPENAMAHVGLGGALGQQGQTEEAIESLRRAIELDPENAMARDMVILAKAYAKLGQVDRCAIWIARLLLLQGMEDDVSLVRRIPLAFSQMNVEFPAAETPSDEAIAEYYEKHADAFSDTAIHLRMISGPKPSKTREFMETLRKELIGGGDFAAAAEAHSDDSAASDGGDRSWVKRGGLREDLDKAAFALKAGEFSEVIEDDTHFRILNVVERKEGTPPPLSEVRDQVIAALKEEARTARIQGWIEEAKKELATDRRAREESQPKSEGDGTTDK